MKAVSEPGAARFERIALIITGDQAAGRFGQRRVGRGRLDLMTFDQVGAQCGGDRPDEAVLKIRGQLGAGEHRLLKAIEPAAARNQHGHRIGPDRRIAVGDQRLQPIGAVRRGAEQPMLFGPAQEQADQIGIAKRGRAVEQGAGNLDMGGGERRIQRLVPGKTAAQRRAQLVLDRPDEASEQVPGDQPLTFGEAQRLGQEQVRRDRRAPAGGAAQQPNGIVTSPLVRPNYGHRHHLARSGLNCR
jgi:hypothetical protein